MEVARTSMIHAAATHFLWPFAVRYATHHLNLWPRVSEPETSPTFRWMGEVGNASVFGVWGTLSLVRDAKASKLSSRTLHCVFLGFPTDAPSWQFYHPRSRRIFSSQDVTFDESICYYRLHPHASHPGLAPSGVSHVDPPPLVEPLEISNDSSGLAEGDDPAADDTAATHCSPRLETPLTAGAEPWGAETEDEGSGGAATGGAATGGLHEHAGSWGAATGGAYLLEVIRVWVVGRGSPGGGGYGPGGAGAASLGGTAPAGRTRGAAGARGARATSPRGTAGAGGAGGAADARDTGAGGNGGAGAAGPGGPCTRGAGANGAGGAVRARGAGGAAGARGTGAGGTEGTGAAGLGGARTRDTGGTGAGGAAGAGGATRAPGTGSVRGTTGARGPGAAGASGAAGARGAGGAARAAGVGGAGAAGAGGAGAAGTALCIPFFYPQPQSPVLATATAWPPLPAPAPHTEVTESLTERREPETRASTPVRDCRVTRPRPPAVPGTHRMALRPSSVPQRVVLPKPPASSLPYYPDPEFGLSRAASPTVTRLLTTIERLDYVASLVTESESVCPPSVRGELSRGNVILEDRLFELECLAAALPRFASMLLCPEGDPGALDIPTPRSYAEAIAGEYSSQWQTAMDAEMVS
ncbi:unnamed protein product [Closterium sp. NIES-54]